MLRGKYGLHLLDKRNGVRWGKVDVSVGFESRDWLRERYLFLSVKIPLQVSILVLTEFQNQSLDVGVYVPKNQALNTIGMALEIRLIHYI